MNFTLSPVVALLVLAAYALVVVVVLVAPDRKPDPQRGMAIGCLGILLAALVATGATLGLAICQEWTWLTHALATAVTYSVVIIAVGLVKAAYDHISR